jgi:pyruvate dehydrogenase E2 component (dihydrolipoamide acetyltransferase)
MTLVPVEVFMPRITHDMTHGVLVRWLKSEGERVAIDEPLFEVETDKAISEVVAEAEGILRGLCFQEGDEIPIGTPMAYLLEEGEALPEAMEGIPSNTTPKDESVETPSIEAVEPDQAEAPEKSVRIIATPIARKMAREKGIDLGEIVGSGPGGRIIEGDVREYLESKETLIPEKVILGEVPYEHVPLTRYQRTTGRRLTQSVQSAPHFIMEIDTDMREVQLWRERYKVEQGELLSYTAILLKAISLALARHPRVNASLDGEQIRLYKEVNIGVAIATDEGLLVPVIRRVNELGLQEIQMQLETLRQQADQGRIAPEHLSGGTFTLSNLGMYGIDRFQAIINPPEAAVLAVGRMREMPWPVCGGVALRPIMNMRLSIDHRVLDGATAAPFLDEARDLLERPDILGD